MENEKNTELTPEENKETIFEGEEFSTEGYDKHIKQARVAIFITAGLVLLSLIISIAIAPSIDYDTLWIVCGVYGIFVGGFIVLGFWVKKKPYTAIICALCLYGLYIALNAYFDISTLYSGWMVKVAIIVVLIKGLNDAREAQRMKDQLGA